MGLVPYFTKLTVSNLVAGNSFFTLHFDETVTAQKRNRWTYLYDSGLISTMK